ncbi:hypothetical protein [uncultured Gemmiger sp.]|uniref:hypothetical protein n=1 Tax=uncultured Gemmiger sp. TaxID=1623490 RepID=UPI0025DEE859|nr:hypothetical protein [uncultured Gemmiger sp.]
MGDFIKELNIIDFLGLLLPGSFLLLMVNYTQTHKLTGLEFTAADIIFLIVGGYVVGSLLHDVWELIELAIWKVIVFFDPKVHAVKNAERVQKKARITLKKKASITLKKKARITLKKKVNITLKNCVEKYFSIKVGMGKSLPFKWNTNDNVWIREADPLIQTALVEKGNYRKRIVFDGFHVMMRNLLCTSILIKVITHCVGIPNPLNEFLREYINNPDAVCVIITVSGFLMAWRSWHYAYLKYKYSYEDFMVLCADKNNKDKNV